MPAKKARKVAHTYRNPMATIGKLLRADERTLDHNAEFFLFHRAEIRQSPITISAYQKLTIRCTKTGKPFARRSMQDWNNLCAIHGSKRAEQILEVNKLQAVSPEWLFTDNTALANLAKYDPHGYFVYAACNILIPVQDSIIRNKTIPASQKTEFQLAWLEQKSALWDNLQSCNVREIMECNEMMRKYLAVFRTAKVAHMLPFKCSHLFPSDLGTPKKTVAEWCEEIRLSISAILKREVKKHRIKAHMTFSDITNLSTHYEGHGNFRRQRQRLTGTDMLADELQKFLPKDFDAYLERKPNLYGLIDRRHEKQKATMQTVPHTKKPGIKIRFASAAKKSASDSEQSPSIHHNISHNEQSQD